MRSRLLSPVGLAGGIVILVVLFALFTSWDPISAGHPSYLVFYFGAGLVGGGATLWVARRRRSGCGWVSYVTAGGLILLALAAWWIVPFSADPIALRAMTDPVDVTVTESATEIGLAPISAEGVSLIFYPGARIDPRAYAAILSEIARRGYPVTIIKPPLGIAFLAADPAVPAGGWAVGGHSLGGVAASSATANGASGLLLWASYPASDISDRSSLSVTSVWGTADAITTPGDIEESISNLPSTADLVPVEGAVHSYFGDYGEQPGDGTPTIDRETAQRAIVDASLGLLTGMSADRG